MSLPIDPAVDFRSDTVTLPSPAMKAFMTEAILGDDVFGEDPSTAALEQKTAERLGHEAGLFFPTGSMANLAALMSHAQPGQVLFCGARSHIKLYEMGSYARLAGLSLNPVIDDDGVLDMDDLVRQWPPDIYYMANPGMVAVENTQNILGGLIYPVEKLRVVRSFTKERGVPLHMDGARLFHAAAGAGCEPRVWTDLVDSTMISISKGLGAPVGSVLTGSSAFIVKARAIRKLLGGGMRQSGILAAAGLYALDHHVALLAEDIRHCRQVYEAIADQPWLKAVNPQTNILIAHLKEPRAQAMVDHLAAAGIHILALSPHTIRAVFHLHHSGETSARLAESMLTFGANG